MSNSEKKEPKKKKSKGLDPKRTEEILHNPDTWDFSGYLETTPEEEKQMDAFCKEFNRQFLEREKAEKEKKEKK